jgi:hypothetical protein
MAARKPRAKRMSAQVVEDEDYQLRHERVAGIDVAKASGMVCLRLPPEPGKGRRSSKTWEVTATVPEIADAAAELRAVGVELVSMESTSDYWRVWVRHEAHCSYSPRSGRKLGEVFPDLMANQGPKG